MNELEFAKCERAQPRHGGTKNPAAQALALILALAFLALGSIQVCSPKQDVFNLARLGIPEWMVSMMGFAEIGGAVRTPRSNTTGFPAARFVLRKGQASGSALPPTRKLSDKEPRCRLRRDLNLCRSSPVMRKRLVVQFSTSNGVTNSIRYPRSSTGLWSLPLPFTGNWGRALPETEIVLLPKRSLLQTR